MADIITSKQERDLADISADGENEAVRRAIGQLHAVHGRVLGAVMNDVDLRRRHPQFGHEVGLRLVVQHELVVLDGVAQLGQEGQPAGVVPVADGDEALDAQLSGVQDEIVAETEALEAREYRRRKLAEIKEALV